MGSKYQVSLFRYILSDNLQEENAIDVGKMSDMSFTGQSHMVDGVKMWVMLIPSAALLNFMVLKTRGRELLISVKLSNMC